MARIFDHADTVRVNTDWGGSMTDELYYRPATELAALLRTRQVSAREVVTAHLERIDEVNPRINAIVTLTADRALEQAFAQDELAARGEFAGPRYRRIGGD